MSFVLGLIPAWVWRWLSIAGAVIAAIFTAYLKGRSEGNQNAKARQAAERLKAREIGDEIDDALAGRDIETNREALKRWSRK